MKLTEAFMTLFRIDILLLERARPAGVDDMRLSRGKDVVQDMTVIP